jgi:CubicO group peptidase (beta-lactamase class C family)
MLTEQSRRVDELFAELDRPGSPGAMVAVQQGDEIVHCKGYGLANVEFNIAWTADTRYRIASVTKQFVGTAVLLLEEQGKLSLADDIRAYLPEMPDYGSPITIRHLLTMTSGIKLDEDLAVGFSGNTGVYDLDYFARLLTRQRGLNFPPGNSVMYSCGNFRSAARIIERVTGQTFDQALTSLIFEPLGMRDTSAPPEYSIVQPNLAYLYYVLPDGVVHRNEDGVAMSGDGAIISTVNDMLKWNEHLRKGLLGGPKLLERWSTVATLNDGTKTGYGLGIGVGRIGDYVAWSHGGLFGTAMTRVPEKDLYVVVFRNREGFPMRSREIAEIYLGIEPTRAAQAANPQFEKLAGRYVQPERGYLLEISAEEGGLQAGLDGDAGRLEPAGPGHFASPPGSDTFRLQLKVDQDDAVQADIGHGRWLPFKPVETNPSHVPASDYLGDYYSDVLELSQRVEERDGNLVLRLDRGQSPLHVLAMEPLGHDTFLAKGGPFHYRSPRIVVKFVRDDHGAVTGTIEHLPTSRDLEFARMSLTVGVPS